MASTFHGHDSSRNSGHTERSNPNHASVDSAHRPRSCSSPLKGHKRSDSCDRPECIPEESMDCASIKRESTSSLPVTCSTPKSSSSRQLALKEQRTTNDRASVGRMKKSASVDPPSPVSAAPAGARMRRSASDSIVLSSRVVLEKNTGGLRGSGIASSQAGSLDGKTPHDGSQADTDAGMRFDVDWSCEPASSTRSHDSSQSDYMDSLSSSYGADQVDPLLTDTPDRAKEAVVCDVTSQNTPKAPSNGHVSDGSSRSHELDKSLNVSIKGSTSKSGSEKKKKGSYWYNSLPADPPRHQSSPRAPRSQFNDYKLYMSQVLSPTYKSRSEDFKKAFKELANEERLVVDYSCALQKDILVQGRLYITPGWICFYANIFRWETVLKIRCRDITAMTKERTARVIPNAIQICTKDEKYFFTSFGARDKTYLMMFRVWQNALCDQQMTSQEIWQWVHYSYGEELGLTSSDDDYVAPTVEDEAMFHASLQQEESILNASTEQNAAEAAQSTIREPEEEGEQHLPLNGDLSLTVPHLPCPEPALNSTSIDDGPSFVVPPRPDKAQPSASVSKKKPASPPKTLIVPPQTNRVSTGDLPTDMGDTSEDNEGEEVRCTGHEHLELVGADEVVAIDVDSVFEMLFTESKFYADFTRDRKTFDVVHGTWPEELDENGEKKRSLNYVLSLNHSIGPKSSPLAEAQTCRQFKPGRNYVVDAECVNSGIPYGDNFYVMNRYCLNRVATGKTRVLITSQIKYRKSVWGFVKNFIEKNATQGIIENFKVLGDMLQQEAVKLSQLSSVQATGSMGRKKVLRRRKNSDRQPSTKRTQPAENLKPPPQPQNNIIPNHIPARGLSVQTPEESWQITLTADSIIRIVCAMDLGGSTEDWQELLTRQQHLHHEEIERWKEVLSASVKLLEHMKRSLLELHNSIDKHITPHATSRDGTE